MSLTNVRWWSDENKCWSHVEPYEAAKKYSYSVAPDQKVFLCGYCHQYVQFITGGVNRSHFKHNGHDAIKACAERIQTLSQSAQYRLKSTVCPPLKLHIQNKQFTLELGFLPLEIEELQHAVNSRAKVHITQDSTCIATYLIDEANFSATRTVFLSIGAHFSSEYRLRIECQVPLVSLPKQWSSIVVGLSPNGTLFDEESLKKIPADGDVVANKGYYLLSKQHVYQTRDISIDYLMSYCGYFLYKVKAMELSHAAATFFLNYRAFLTAEPAQLSPIWPPVMESDNCVDTGRQEVYFVLRGKDIIAEAFPSQSRRALWNVFRPSDTVTSLIKLQNNGHVQIVWAARSTVLRYIYIRPLQPLPKNNISIVNILDADNQRYENGIYNILPQGRSLSIQTSFDGSIIQHINNQLVHITSLRAGQIVALDKVRFGLRIQVRIGRDQVGDIEFVPPGAEYCETTLLEQIQKAKGRYVPMPRRYGWLLKKYDGSVQIQQFIKQAVFSGEVRQDALAKLTTFSWEGK